MIARPHHDQAQEVLGQYQTAKTRTNTSLAVPVLMLLWLMILDPGGTLGRVAYIVVPVLALVMIALRIFRTPGGAKAYAQHLQAGDIIELDPYLVKAWDQLRREKGIVLTEQERTLELQALFNAAGDLAQDVARHRELKGEAELAQERLRCRARIRARLLQEVEALQVRQDTEREIQDDDETRALQIGVTQDEVEEQLRILKERKDQS
jgi:hypothetical protein